MTEIQVLFVANIVVAFSLSLCIALVAFGRERHLWTWALAYALHGMVHVFLGLRGLIPDFFSVILANVFIAVMVALYTEGIFRFEKLRPPRLLIWWTTPAIALIFWYYIDDFDMRLLIGAALWTYQTAFLVLTIAKSFNGRGGVEGRGKWILILAATLMTVMFTVRTVFVLNGDGSMVTITSSNAVQSFTFLVGIVSVILFAIGPLVMYKERAEQEYLTLAQQDPLTQLGNRRVLDGALVDAFKRSSESQEYGAMLMLDLNNFKPLNDQYGHSVGDQLLIEVAYRLKESVKLGDTVVRLGGDEFVILLPDLGTSTVTARDNAEVVAKRILSEIAKPYNLLSVLSDSAQASINYGCTASVGAALYCGNTIGRSELLERADIAMYKAKEAGASQLVFYSDDTA